MSKFFLLHESIDLNELYPAVPSAPKVYRRLIFGAAVSEVARLGFVHPYGHDATTNKKTVRECAICCQSEQKQVVALSFRSRSPPPPRSPGRTDKKHGRRHARHRICTAVRLAPAPLLDCRRSTDLDSSERRSSSRRLQHAGRSSGIPLSFSLPLFVGQFGQMITQSGNLVLTTERTLGLFHQYHRRRAGRADRAERAHVAHRYTRALGRGHIIRSACPPP